MSDMSDDFYTDLPVGEILRRARLQKGMTLPEAAQYLYIRESHLQALEDSNFDALPGRVYVIGFIRTYAEFLGLDGARVVELLKRQSDGLGTPQSLNMHLLPSDNRLPGVPVIAVAFASLILLIVLWVVYQNARIGQVDQIAPVEQAGEAPLEALQKIVEEHPVVAQADPVAEVQKNTQETPVATNEQKPADDAVPNTEASEAPVLPAAPPVRILLREDSWLEIRGPDSRVVQARVFRKGETFDITSPVDEFGHAYAVTMGNAAGVEIQVGGRTVPALGDVNQVRRNVSLNPKALTPLLPDR